MAMTFSSIPLTEDQLAAVEHLKQSAETYWQRIEEYNEDSSAKTECPLIKQTELFRNLYRKECTSAVDKNNEPEVTYVLDFVKGVDQTLQELDKASKLFHHMKNKFNDLSTRTSSLYDACNELTADEANLIASAEQVRSRLSYFDAYDQLAHKLSSPLLSVTSESFMHAVATIDEGITFFTAQAQYKDAPLYLSKYQQCLTKALQHVKAYVIKSLSSATQDVLTKVQEGTVDAFTQYYCLFAANAGQVQALLKEFEPKRQKCPEYAAMLDECYGYYFSQREQLIRPRFEATISQLLNTHMKSCCSLTRSGCSVLFRLCDDEYNLTREFFLAGQHAFDAFVTKLARHFYNAIRPQIIHVQHLETLIELNTLLRVKMLGERCYMSEVGVYVGLATVLEEILGDITERLLYRAQLYARNEIGNYEPGTGDLAYPEKLEMIQAIAKVDQGNGTKDSGGTASDIHGLWYPTVQRTVACLSKLNSCLDATSFQGVAYETVNMCVKSLMEAQSRIEASKGSTNANLFLIKHLLILRAHIAPKMCEVFSEPSVDFSKIKESAVGLLQRKAQWFALSGNNAFLQFMLQMPAQTAEHVIDSRRELDITVKLACQNFIAHSVKIFVGELTIFLEQAKQSLQGTEAKKPLNKYPFAEPKLLSDLVLRAYRNLKTKIPEFRHLMSLYLCNEETENILFAPIKKQIKETYATMGQLIAENYDGDDRHVIALTSEEEVSLLLR
uniref:Conserved oligomeric Golgi complex subunit 3 n=1 Tax=Trichuris muris TaxID=70415 RepID=A0A5S6QXG9_TRIMR